MRLRESSHRCSSLVTYRGMTTETGVLALTLANQIRSDYGQRDLDYKEGLKKCVLESTYVV